MTGLQLLWFTLIGLLFSGFFFLEGFDFGVGMSVQTLAHNEEEKDQIVKTIGPVWDGNEVWLLTAGVRLVSILVCFFVQRFLFDFVIDLSRVDHSRCFL